MVTPIFHYIVQLGRDAPHYFLGWYFLEEVRQSFTQAKMAKMTRMRLGSSAKRKAFPW
jgi:hypothetical protein